jgi:hypothetical protein
VSGDALHKPRVHGRYDEGWCELCADVWPCLTARLLHPEEGPS